MTPNFNRFVEELTRQYGVLFLTPEYALNASRRTPQQAAEKMAAGLRDGTANKDGEGIRRTCKALGIKTHLPSDTRVLRSA